MIDLIYGLDLKAFNAVFGLRSFILTYFMRLFSQLGDSALVWLVAAVLLLLSRKTRKTAFSIGVSLLMVLLLVDLGLKGIVQRPRPFDYAPWQSGLFTYPELIVRPGDFSYPSVHAASSFAAATAVFCNGKKAYKKLLLFAAAAVISFSRLYLGVSYLSDIVAGALLGAIFGAVGSLLVRAVLDLCKKAGFGFMKYFDL